MTKGKNTPGFFSGNTPPKDLIRIVFEQIWIILVKIFYLGEKTGSILFGPMRRDLVHDYVVHNVGEPWNRLDF